MTSLSDSMFPGSEAWPPGDVGNDEGVLCLQGVRPIARGAAHCHRPVQTPGCRRRGVASPSLLPASCFHTEAFLL